MNFGYLADQSAGRGLVAEKSNSALPLSFHTSTLYQLNLLIVWWLRFCFGFLLSLTAQLFCSSVLSTLYGKVQLADSKKYGQIATRAIPGLRMRRGSLSWLAMGLGLGLFAAAQPPFMGGQWLDAPELSGQPIEVEDSRDADGQYCGRMCNADPNCTGFNYAPYDCKAPEPCPYKLGCCWLVSGPIGADQISSSAPNCASSFIMRAPLPTTTTPSPAPVGAKNVLYVLVDDLRPDVAPFGASWMVTPSIQGIANAGTTFDRAYTAISVCSPSRMSFLTGRYPHNTRTFNFVNHVRQADCTEYPAHAIAAGPASAYSTTTLLGGGAGQCCSDCTADDACAAWTVHAGSCMLYNASVDTALVPGPALSVSGLRGKLDRRSWTTLPQHFKDNGYLTMGSGKVFHTEEGGTGPQPWVGPGTGMPPLQDPISWSPGNASMSNVNALAPMRQCADGIPPASDGCAVPATKQGDVEPGTFTFEDRTIADDALAKLRIAADNRKSGGQPFFLAVGFRKPHLPFRHPKPWSDIYPTAPNIPLAKYKVLDASQPPIAFHQTSLAVNPFTPLPDEQAGRLRRDYYGAISWTDSQIGRVTSELAALGLTNDTLVVFHSDHGWSLGEHGEWEVRCNVPR